MAAILIAAMALEIRTGRIPNWLTAVPCVVFAAVLVLADDRAALYWQLGLSAVVFVLGVIMFAVGGMGAGAVKLLAGTVLFVPWENAFYTLLVYLGVFFVSSVIFVQVRKMFGSEDSAWHVMANAVIPLSFSIGVAGIIGMFVL
jgi:prepilin peptidase CpaA